MNDHNYYSTFLSVAEDSRALTGVVPEAKAGKDTVASLQYKLISKAPYELTQEDVLFKVYALRNNIADNDLKKEREKFFSKRQPCLRTSPLGKAYGWGIHFRRDGKIALYAVDSGEYRQYSRDKSLKQIKAMRSGK
ncbi:MAG: DUF6157 family protein [Elusimicrobia bacterium]|nr:DUF6157 family protein [Elusimicrobiota bacterium]